MEVLYHPLVQRDVLDATRYYRRIRPTLAMEFRKELRVTIDHAADNPLRFPPVAEGLRRANLKRFPYHVLYDVHQDSIRILIVRHDKRHPDFGLNRKD